MLRQEFLRKDTDLCFYLQYISHILVQQVSDTFLQSLDYNSLLLSRDNFYINGTMFR